MQGRPGDRAQQPHAHVRLDQFSDREREAALVRAAQAGVRWLLTAGLDVPSSRRAAHIAAGNERVLAAVGLHPWQVGESPPATLGQQLTCLARAAHVVAVGEVGLDFIDNAFTGVDYRSADQLRRAQLEAFRQQVEIARELDLPLVLHCRGAYLELIAVLREEKAYRVRGMVHNFDGARQAMARLLDMGLLLSIGGAITYPEALPLRRAVRYIPPDGLLIETDAPYMPLHPDSGERNEPANVRIVAHWVAQLKGVEEMELVETCYRSFARMFGLPT
ncbi:MAG: TatD family hydrolase [Candidatus Bipolaricaulaceae bacterium]